MISKCLVGGALEISQTLGTKSYASIMLFSGSRPNPWLDSPNMSRDLQILHIRDGKEILEPSPFLLQNYAV